MAKKVDLQAEENVRILVANDSPKVEKSIASLSKRGWLSWLRRTGGVPRHHLTVYYPYYFRSWRATIPKSLGRTMKVRLITGVNGMRRSTSPADGWPVEEEIDLAAGQVIRPRTSESEAEELTREYIERFVFRRYRPSKPPKLEEERFALIYVPYYVYAMEGQPLRKAALVEGFTGAVGRVKDVPEISELVTGRNAASAGKGR